MLDGVALQNRARILRNADISDLKLCRTGVVRYVYIAPIDRVLYPGTTRLIFIFILIQTPTFRIKYGVADRKNYSGHCARFSIAAHGGFNRCVKRPESSVTWKSFLAHLNNGLGFFSQRDGDVLLLGHRDELR